MTQRRDRIIVAIAVFRLVKALGLVLAGAGVLHGGALEHLVASFTHLPSHRIHELAWGAFAYAALFTTEGVGLLLRKRWAEWLTIIATTSFIPFEIIEVVRKPTALRIAIVIANAAIVVYLIWRRRSAK